MNALLLLRAALVPALLLLPAAKADAGEILVIVHPENTVSHLDRDALYAIFSRARQYWSGGQPIVAWNAPPNSALRATFDRAVLDLSPQEVGRFWTDQGVRGGPRPPRKASRATLAVAAVRNLRNSVAYVPASTPVVGVRVVARIRCGRVVEPDAPEEPCAP